MTPAGTRRDASTATKVPGFVTLPEQQVIEFIITESLLADEHRYEEWELLWADEALYWVCGPGDFEDPKSGLYQASFIYDNRARIASRIRQLGPNRRLSQVPSSALARAGPNFLPTP